MSAPTVEFFFDYVSPYSYLADARIADVCREAGATLVYRPFFLGGVMKAAENRPPGLVAAKARYMLTDLERWASSYGVPMRFAARFPQNTLRAMRVALAAQDAGVFEPYHRAAFRAVWAEGRDLGNEGDLVAVLHAAGLAPGRLLDASEEPALKERLKAQTQEAVDRGAFGAPTFFVGDTMFFGNDRLDHLAAHLRG